MASARAEKVLLVGWDGADWPLLRPLLAAGELPQLAQLRAEGVSGDLASPAPLVSSMLWTSLATGKRPQKHGVLSELEPAASEPAGVRPASSRSRRVHALWNLLTHAGLRSVIAGWPATHPAEPIHGALLTDRYAAPHPGARQEGVPPDGALHPPRLRNVLAELRVQGVELAEPELLSFVPRASALEALDPTRLETLTDALAADVTLHAAATCLLEKEPWAFAAVRYTAVERLSRAFLEFAHPRGDRVDARDARLYGEVVANAHRFQDRMLARLVDLAGPDAIVVVVATHGYHRAGGQRRPRGLLCMSGPKLRRGAEIQGAHLLDVAPTLLAGFGLPVGNDMDGRPLLHAFAEPARLWSIRSWEELGGDFGTLPKTRREAAPAKIEDPEAARGRQRASRTQLANLALAHLVAGEVEPALPILEELVGAEPDNTTHIFALAQALHRSGQRPRAWSLLERLEAADPEVELLRGTLLADEGLAEQALAALRGLESRAPDLPGLHPQLGTTLLALDRLLEAERAFERALEVEGESAEAQHGLSVTYLRQKRYDEAADRALRAVGIQHFFPDAHFHLGVALAHCGQQATAIQAFETCLALRPDTPEAHRWLSRIHERAYGDRERARWHRRQLDRLAGDPI